MTSTGQPLGPRPAGRAFVLLVLLVLAGVLGMHALPPNPAAAGPHTAAAQTADRHGGHTPATVPAEPGPASADCSHSADGSHHLAHADATCAAAGTASAYAPPALTAALTGAGAPPPLSGAAADVGTAGRAPPDLAELQLLRI
ncbi:hypothetical protein C0216_17565 [Streptomyces globosus]|uniref:DUF1328 domain-containing protein n=1 Tax=Streptomyces globosus TaxID=68209 RepID=A0A344U294_9ACTN|nr:DUF6153 family protein [Streptomyces globosus]AXE25015.1 hypothetical protein C0216_17565 [Streptomyces globosus]